MSDSAVTGSSDERDHQQSEGVPAEDVQTGPTPEGPKPGSPQMDDLVEEASENAEENVGKERAQQD